MILERKAPKLIFPIISRVMKPMFMLNNETMMWFKFRVFQK